MSATVHARAERASGCTKTKLRVRKHSSSMHSAQVPADQRLPALGTACWQAPPQHWRPFSSSGLACAGAGGRVRRIDQESQSSHILPVLEYVTRF